jgi:hypothetical protein
VTAGGDGDVETTVEIAWERFTGSSSNDRMATFDRVGSYTDCRILPDADPTTTIASIPIP